MNDWSKFIDKIYLRRISEGYLALLDQTCQYVGYSCALYHNKYPNFST